MKKSEKGYYERFVTINGKRKHFYGKTKKELEEKIDNYKQSSKVDGSVLLSVVVDSWQEYHFQHLEENTIKGYRPNINHIVKAHGNVPIGNVQAKDIALWLSVFGLNHTKKTVKNLSSIYSMIFDYAILQGYVQFNPVKIINTASIGQNGQPRRALYQEEVKAVLENKNTLMGFMAYFALYTGIRRSEIVALQYKDINFKDKYIPVKKAVYYKNNKPYFKVPKTEAGIRYVPLPDKLAEELKSKNYKPDDYIFPDDKNEPMHSRRIDGLWAKYRLQAGLPEEVGLHYLRHTYSTMLYNIGVDDVAKIAIIGHSDIETTNEIYTHIDPKNLKTIGKNINNFKFK